MPDPWAPTYNDTLAAILAHPDVTVWRHCSRCGLHRKVSREEIAALVRDPQYGPLYSLWNRRPKPCLTPGCDSANFYMSGREGGINGPMTSSDPMIAKLHRRWRRSRDCLIKCCGDDDG